MPTYLLHGFRWLRPAIRIHVIVNDIDDAAPEWVSAPDTSRTILDGWTKTWPEIMKSLPDLRLIEQYDPEDETISSQPYAYVADTVHEVKLGMDVSETVAQKAAVERDDALRRLREGISMGVGADEKIAWFVVVCGDEERAWTEGSATSTVTGTTELSQEGESSDETDSDDDDTILSADDRLDERKGKLPKSQSKE